jgi:hypothetical protein
MQRRTEDGGWRRGREQGGAPAGWTRLGGRRLGLAVHQVRYREQDLLSASRQTEPNLFSFSIANIEIFSTSLRPTYRTPKSPHSSLHPASFSQASRLPGIHRPIESDAWDTLSASVRRSSGHQWSRLSWSGLAQRPPTSRPALAQHYSPPRAPLDGPGRQVSPSLTQSFPQPPLPLLAGTSP